MEENKLMENTIEESTENKESKTSGTETNENKQETEIGVQYTYWMLMDNAWQAQWGTEYAPSLEQPQLWTRPYVHSYAAYDGLTLPVGSDEQII